MIKKYTVDIPLKKIVVYLLKSIIVLGLFLYFLKIEIENVFQVILFKYYFLGIFELFILLIFLICVRHDVGKFLKSKNSFRLIFTIVGSLMISMGLFVKIWDLKRHSESTQYIALYSEKKGVYTEDYTFRFQHNGNLLLQVSKEDGLISNYYYGRYFMNKQFISIEYLFGKKSKYTMFSIEKNILIPISYANYKIKKDATIFQFLKVKN